MPLKNQIEKLDSLKNILRECGSVLIAFSGGLDSTFLLKVAAEVLGRNAVGVTAQSSTYPDREYRDAVRLAEDMGARHITITSEELDIEGFSANTPRRCYFCKKELFTKLQEIARQEGIRFIADGANSDDVHDYRPGLEAAAELGIISPLKQAGLTKDDIRALSRDMGLTTWDKPSFACLASRFPYGERITPDNLSMVARAEDLLHDLGFRQFRVRHHGTIARIEVPQEELPRLIEPAVREKILAAFKNIGYQYVAADLSGYRSGSMNIPLGKEPVK